ncbi:MAG: hypothetical protein ACP5HQ_02445 [Thermoprotei archaeon]
MTIDLVLLALIALLPGSWFFYTLTIQEGSQVQIYYYNFTVVNVTSASLAFRLSLSGPGTTQTTITETVPVSNPGLFPLNGSAFGVTNVTYVAKVGNYSVYEGVFRYNGLTIPVTMYYNQQGILYNYSGSSNGVKVIAQLQASYTPPTQPGPEPGGLFIVIVVLIALAIGVVTLVKIGKI